VDVPLRTGADALHRQLVEIEDRNFIEDTGKRPPQQLVTDMPGAVTTSFSNSPALRL